MVRMIGASWIARKSGNDAPVHLAEEANGTDSSMFSDGG